MKKLSLKHTEEAHLDPNDPRNLELFRLVQSIPSSADEAQYFRCAPLIQQIYHPLFLPLFLPLNFPPSFLFCPPSSSAPFLFLPFLSFSLSVFPLPPLLPPSSPSSLLSFPFLPSSLPPHLPSFYLSPSSPPPSLLTFLLSFPCWPPLPPLSLRLLDVDNEERFVSDQQFSNDRRFQLLQLRDQGVSHDTSTTI